jgi:hypothetical protein
VKVSGRLQGSVMTAEYELDGLSFMALVVVSGTIQT